MKNSIFEANATATATRRIAVVLAFAVMASLPLRVAHAGGDDRRGQSEQQDRGQQQDRGRHGEEGRARREPPRSARYRRYPVYAPPPVYYPRYESPGIRLVFPFDIH